MELKIEEVKEYIDNIASAPEELVHEAYRWWDDQESGIEPAYKHFVIMASYFEEIYSQLLKINEEN